MQFGSEQEAITYVFRSLRNLRERTGGEPRGYDEFTRDTSPTVQLLAAAGLLDTPREYAVVTGSKGKGSTTAIAARLLRQLGHTVGMVSSPHLVSYRERIRVNGRAIPEADLCAILADLAPYIDHIERALTTNSYFSPQGIFLAIALRYFDQQGVSAAVLEVGRGGRFDDIAVVPNKLSLFTPIMLEHPNQLGPTLERIAWHKAGIIKPHSFAYSVPQPSSVLDVLQTEADAQDAEFFWIAPMDMGQFVAHTPHGIRFTLGRYGEVELSLHGRYQIENATLAVQGVGNMHARLPGIAHGDPAYVQAIRQGLASVIWPGRLQQLDDAPAVYVDGAINGESARQLVLSLEDRLSDPVIGIVCVPDDKDYLGVYREIGLVSETLILTETTRNVTLHFPAREAALEAARRFNDDARFEPTLADAMRTARTLAGAGGTILIVGTQSIIADAVNLWGLSYEQI
jgi:dihydrofolate synthase/folylpolyglutamate synthase